MDPRLEPMTAGIISTLLFASSNIPMLVKAYRTHDLKSYSPLYLGLSNIGNLIHWFYILSLPFGPIWFLHAIFTIACLLMLLWYVRYEGSGIIRGIKMEIFRRDKKPASRWRALCDRLRSAWEQLCTCGDLCRCLQICRCVLAPA